MLWTPERPKKFGNNTELTCLNAIGLGWISDGGYGGGLSTIDMNDIPLADLANVLEWLLNEHLKGTK
jgi:hypothetical protein